jgi:hypothetical protein
LSLDAGLRSRITFASLGAIMHHLAAANAFLPTQSLICRNLEPMNQEGGDGAVGNASLLRRLARCITIVPVP